MCHLRLDIFYPGRGCVFARFRVIVEEVRWANRSYQLAVILYKVSDTHTEYPPDETWPRVESSKITSNEEFSCDLAIDKALYLCCPFVNYHSSFLSKFQDKKLKKEFVGENKLCKAALDVYYIGEI